MNHITSRRTREPEKFEPVPGQCLHKDNDGVHTRTLKLGESLIIDGVKVVTRQEDIDAETAYNTMDDSGGELDIKPVFTTTMIEMPIVQELPKGVYGNMHIDMQLTRPEAQTMHRIFKGCQDGPNPARLKKGTGRFVGTYADVVRLWLEKAGGG
jgi:hypothetical protein